MARTNVSTTTNDAVCLRCKGKKVLYMVVFGEHRVICCSVCNGHGVVPHKPVDRLRKVNRGMESKVFDKAQGRLF